MNFTGNHFKDIIRERSLYMCLECGKCSASCPRMLAGKAYSPRLLAFKLVAEPEDESFIENSVWECLTCGLCEERCPSGVEYSRFILDMRTALAAEKGLKGYRAHDGAPAFLDAHDDFPGPEAKPPGLDRTRSLGQ